MTTDRWRDDDQLLADLAEAVRATDPLTGWIRRLGDQVPLYRQLHEDIELAVLTYDSALDPALVARNGGTAEYRTLLFQAGSAQLQIERLGDQANGQVMPARGGIVCVDTREGTVACADVDDLGCFSLARVVAGILRFVWRADHRVVATDWITWC